MPDEPIDVVVSIDGEDVAAGRLFSHRRQNRESASFEYASSYLARPDSYALDPSLPLAQGGHQSPDGLEMFRSFADSAPDRWGRTLLTRAEKRAATNENRATRSLGEIGFLLGVRDDLRQGALRFREPRGVYLAPPDKGVPALTELLPLLRAAESFEADKENAAELRELIQLGSSLGGARPKAHVIDTDGQVSIAKFPSALHDTWNVMAWEKVALDLAKAAGITVPDSELLWINGRSVLVIRRFDREQDLRIGYASAMTMLEAKDGDTGSYLEIAETITRRSPATTEDLQQLWRRIAFSVLISNTDDHLRNHGFLHVEKDSWSLSPAFDLNPNPAPGEKHLSTTIDGYDTAAKIEPLMEVAEWFRLTHEQAIGVLADVVAATRNWKEVALEYRLTESDLRQMESAFEHPETEAARELVSWRDGETASRSMR